MDTIFHERQEGQLCAQHCLNALLQGPFYTAVDLATLGQQLDDEERQQIADGQGADSDEYRRFLQQPSGNMDDTGFFSVQVIARAIGVWGLELVSYSSSDARAITAKIDPTSQNAFICNYREHWLTVRRLGNQWFNLNSLLTGPELISNTFLSMFLTQLENEGYTVYVVLGELPSCTADQVLSLERAIQAEPPGLIGEAPTGARSRPLVPRRDTENEDEELQRALALSLAHDQKMASAFSEGPDEDLELAMRLSQSMSQAQAQFQPTAMDVTGAMASGRVDDQSNVLSEEDEIQRAIQMSLQSLEQMKKDVGPSTKPKETPPKASQSQSVPPMRASEQPRTTKPVSPVSDATKSQSTPLSKPSTSSSRVQPSPKTPSQPSSLATAAGKAMSATPASPPSKPHTEPNMVPMPGSGNRVGGEDRVAVARQSTPDPDEVRRRRMAFLDKMQKDGGNK